MRLLALFFSFYILLLTALPCADAPARNPKQDAPISQSSTSHNDECSPFCTCNCCAMAMVCQVQAVDFKVIPIVREHLTSYPTLSVTQRSGDIWQPPQLI
jgi:hypothetical protein